MTTSKRGPAGDEHRTPPEESGSSISSRPPGSSSQNSKAKAGSISWRHGFRRIALILAVVVAVASSLIAALNASHSKPVEEARRQLERVRDLRADSLSTSQLAGLVESWRGEAVEARDEWWYFYTGEHLPPLRSLRSRIEEQALPRPSGEADWAVQGWRRANGDPLPYSPIRVLLMYWAKKTDEAAEDLMWTQRGCIAVGAVMGLVGGFCGFCLVYFTFEALLSWIGAGFNPTRKGPKVYQGSRLNY